jgi:alternate signal-mediated exported protein
MKRKIALAASAVVLAALLITGGTLAWFTDEQTATNIVTTGNVKIALHDSATDIEWDGSSAVTDPVSDFAPVGGIVPSETVGKFVTVKNTGDNDAYVRIQIVPVWYKTVEGTLVELTENEKGLAGIDEDGIGVDSIAYTVNGTDWTARDEDGYYIYKGILTSGQTAPTLLSAVTFNSLLDNRIADLTVKIEIKAEAIQSDNMTGYDYETVWGATSSSVPTPV